MHGELNCSFTRWEVINDKWHLRVQNAPFLSTSFFFDYKPSAESNNRDILKYIKVLFIPRVPQFATDIT